MTPPADGERPAPANDYDAFEGKDGPDPRILRIAAAIGRQLARELLAANLAAINGPENEEEPLDRKDL